MTGSDATLNGRKLESAGIFPQLASIGSSLSSLISYMP